MDLDEYFKRPVQERIEALPDPDSDDEDWVDEEMAELERLGVSFNRDDIWKPPPSE